jgi:hypothetical protein
MRREAEAPNINAKSCCLRGKRPVIPRRGANLDANRPTYRRDFSKERGQFAVELYLVPRPPRHRTSLYPQETCAADMRSGRSVRLFEQGRILREKLIPKQGVFPEQSPVHIN